MDKIPCRIQPSTELPHTETVVVGTDIWDALSPRGDERRIAVAIRPFKVGDAKKKAAKSILCWAISDDSKAGLVKIPPEWETLHRHIFPRDASPVHPIVNTHHVSRSRTLPLQEIFVQALSEDAYRAATEDAPAFVQSLCREQRILRQGSTFTIDAADMPSQSVDQSRSTFKYRLTMLEPVLQGHADKDSTRVVILPASDDTPTKNVTSFNGSSITSSGDGVDDENDDLEIDESFLANSLNSHMPNGVEYHNAGPSAPDDNIHSSLMSSSSGHEFTAQPLPDDLVAPLASEFTVFVRTSDLPRIGIQDGDWALARSKHSIKSRLVRVKAHDEMVKTSGHAYVPLILLRNVFHEISIEDSKLHLQACPGGLPPSIPTAKTVTVARVASRVSTNRVYQQMLLQSLQDYFDRSKRLISQGDLLAVPVDIGSKLDTTDEEADEVLVEEHCSRTFRSDSLEHFVVTSIDSNASGVRHDRLAGDVYVGELGSWVDPLITRMLQTGVEHVRIPHHLPADIQASSSSERDSVVVNRKAFDQIYALTSATFSPQASTYDLPLSILLKGPRGTGKFTTAAQVAQSLGMQVFEINCYDILGVNDTKAEGFLRARFDQATSCAPCIIVMRHLDAFAQSTQAPEPGKEPPLVTALEELFADLYGAWRLFGYPVLVYGTTSEPGRVPPPISACFKHEVEFEVPGESERLQILQSLLSSRTIAPDVSLQDLARRTAALVAADLRDLVTRADIAAITRVMEAVPDECSEEDVFVAGMALTTADFDVAMNEARASYSQNIGAPTIPNVSWDDVGGLANVKSEILDTIQLPLEHPELFAQDLKKRSGILLYGPPGTGKTLLAKAVATSCSLNFFSVKGPELLNMYIGESEANVRRVFQRARDARPCVIFFDELDSVAPKRGNHGDSGGVMDRIVSQLLAELDGISAGGSGDVFVIGATNRPDLLDSALLRPGRFDRMLYLGVSDTKEAQVNILQALTRKFRLDPNLDWDAIVDKCTFNFTGADFYALCSDALLKAMSRKAEAIDQKLSIFNQSPEAAGNHPIPVTPQYYLSEIATPEEVEVTVSQEDFETALRELTPSVSQSEMEHYAKVQQRFSSTSTSKTTGDHDRDSDGGE